MPRRADGLARAHVEEHGGGRAAGDDGDARGGESGEREQRGERDDDGRERAAHAARRHVRAGCARAAHTACGHVPRAAPARRAGTGEGRVGRATGSRTLRRGRGCALHACAPRYCLRVEAGEQVAVDGVAVDGLGGEHEVAVRRLAPRQVVREHGARPRAGAQPAAVERPGHGAQVPQDPRAARRRVHVAGEAAGQEVAERAAAAHVGVDLGARGGEARGHAEARHVHERHARAEHHARGVRVLGEVELARGRPPAGVAAEPHDHDPLAQPGVEQQRRGHRRQRRQGDDEERRLPRPRAGDQVLGGRARDRGGRPRQPRPRSLEHRRPAARDLEDPLELGARAQHAVLRAGERSLWNGAA